MLRRVFVTLWVIGGLTGCGSDSTVETSPAARPPQPAGYMYAKHTNDTINLVWPY